MTDKPDLTRVWAKDAPSNNIVDPDATTPGKFSNGWEAEVPPFEHFNFIQKFQTQGLAHINEQGIAVWDTNTVYPVGGLAKGSDGNVYKALVSQNNNDPVSDNGTNWIDEINNRVIRATSVAAVEALTGVADYQVSLSGETAGIFEFSTADLSTEVAADPDQATYIAPSSDDTGTSGAWVRLPVASGGGGSAFGTTVTNTVQLLAAIEADANKINCEAGTYLLSSILLIPSNTIISGAGKGATILKATPGTDFPSLSPSAGLSDGPGFQKTFIAPFSAGSDRSNVAVNIVIRDLTIDWSNNQGIPDGQTAGRVVAPLMVNSVDGMTVQNVDFINCLPSDYSADLQSSGVYVSRSHSSAVSSSNNIVYENCDFGTSGYRSFAAAYNSQNVILKTCNFLTAQPWRHSAEVHSGGAGFLPAHVTFDGCNFQVTGGAQEDCISFHGGSGRVINCNFKLNTGIEMKRLIKIFDESKNVQICDNFFSFQSAQIIGAIVLGDDVNGVDQNSEACNRILISGNIIDCFITANSDADRATLLPIIGTGDQVDEHRSLVITNNIITITLAENIGQYAINVANCLNSIISGNEVYYANSNVSIGVGYRIDNTLEVAITGNKVTGTYYRGFFIRGGNTPTSGLICNNISLSGTESDYSAKSLAAGQFVKANNLFTTVTTE